MNLWSFLWRAILDWLLLKKLANQHFSVWSELLTRTGTQIPHEFPRSFQSACWVIPDPATSCAVHEGWTEKRRKLQHLRCRTRDITKTRIHIDCSFLSFEGLWMVWVLHWAPSLQVCSTGFGCEIALASVASAKGSFAFRQLAGTSCVLVSGPVGAVALALLFTDVSTAKDAVCLAPADFCWRRKRKWESL